MTDFSVSVLLPLFFFFSAPFLFGWIAVALRMPALIGYIVGGIVLGVFLRSGTAGELLPSFAAIGLILLLFTVGLELDLTQFTRFKKFVIIGGVAQIAVSALFMTIVSLLFRFDFQTSFIIGWAVALSSTAVAAKLIQERGEEYSLLGTLVIGILLFQDVVGILLLIIFSSISQQFGPWETAFTVVLNLIKSAAVFFLMYRVGKRVIPFLYSKLSQISRELVNFLTIIFILGSIAVFSFLQLPATVAAFLSGVLAAQTMEHYHIFSQIRPLRDIFAILFFVFLGAQVDFVGVITHLPAIAVFAVLLLIVKFTVVLIIFLLMRFHSRTAFGAALLLSQAGEFSFMVLQLGQTKGAISSDIYMVVMPAVLISIAAAPLLFAYKDRWYFAIKKIARRRFFALYSFLESYDREPAHMHASFEMKNHVVICGFGRLGRYIGRALTLAGIPFAAIDYNYHVVRQGKKSGLNIIYGDPTDIDVLDFVQTEAAAAIIIGIPDKFSQEAVTLHARRLNRDIMIFTRVHEEGYQRRMKDLGAHVVVQPEFEAALSIVKKILIHFNVSRDTIVGKIKRLKLEHGMG